VSAGFDNTLSSMLTVFQCMTLSSWSYIMYRVMDATSPLSAFYFVVLVLLGAYFVVRPHSLFVKLSGLHHLVQKRMVVRTTAKA
jgi:hypothetical protein